MDPPWKYEGNKYKPTYPCLDDKQLKLLPINAITHSNSILLMWSTMPKQEEAIKLMGSYGFKY